MTKMINMRMEERRKITLSFSDYYVCLVNIRSIVHNGLSHCKEDMVEGGRERSVQQHVGT
jgi:uncharacterized membrane protein